MRETFPVIVLIFAFFFVIAGTSFSHCSATNPVVEIVSVETGKTTFSSWNPSFYFYKNEVLSIKVTARNNDNTARTAVIYLNAFDELDTPFGVNIMNVEFSANETKIMYGPIYIPNWAFSGTGRVTTFAKTLPEGTYCLEKTAAFYVSRASASYLKLQASPTEDGINLSASVDGDSGFVPATIPLDPGTHALQIQTISYEWFAGFLCKYTFKHWENGLTSAPRTIDISMSTNQTVIAYYHRERCPFQPS